MSTKKHTPSSFASSPPFLLVCLLWLVALPASAQPEGTCTPDADTLCLQSGRFSVEVDWDDTVSTGVGQVLPLLTDTTGFLYYQDPLYLDLMIKVIDGCLLNGRFWVFSAGLSDAIQTITVTDTTLGTVKTYDNMLGDFPTFTDTDAMPCSPPFTSPFAAESPPATSDHIGGSEGPPLTTLSLVEGRFRVEVDWQDFDTNTGDGIPEQVTDHSGAFWFFSSTNYELIVKIVDASSIDGFYWLFFGATTNVEYNVQVTDICTGASQSYTHPLGASVDTTVDLTTFSAAGTCDIFADGFESGDTTLWSFSLP